jgi:mRNA-degrading endonuclease toxin of MazEF toxin-antitoxin module
MPLPQPKRGEIWCVPFPSDPPGKRNRFVLIVSHDTRNHHPRAETVLAIPFSTTPSQITTHIRLQPGETGLPETCELQPENISAIRKECLVQVPGTRTLSESIIRRLVRGVALAMAVQPRDIPNGE